MILFYSISTKIKQTSISDFFSDKTLAESPACKYVNALAKYNND